MGSGASLTLFACLPSRCRPCFSVQHSCGTGGNFTCGARARHTACKNSGAPEPSAVSCIRAGPSGPLLPCTGTSPRLQLGIQHAWASSALGTFCMGCPRHETLAVHSVVPRIWGVCCSGLSASWAAPSSMSRCVSHGLLLARGQHGSSSTLVCYSAVAVPGIITTCMTHYIVYMLVHANPTALPMCRYDHKGTEAAPPAAARGFMPLCLAAPPLGRDLKDARRCSCSLWG